MHDHHPADTAIGRLARRLAAELASQARGGALVVLTDPLTGRAVGRVTAGPSLPPGIGSIAELAVPSDPIVCDATRVHHSGLRSLARVWGSEHLLIVPCLFGDDLVAVAVVPAPDERSAELIAAVTPLSERFSAAVVRARLVAGAFTPAGIAAAG